MTPCQGENQTCFPHKDVVQNHAFYLQKEIYSSVKRNSTEIQTIVVTMRNAQCFRDYPFTSFTSLEFIKLFWQRVPFIFGKEVEYLISIAYKMTKHSYKVRGPTLQFFCTRGDLSLFCSPFSLNEAEINTESK